MAFVKGKCGKCETLTSEDGIFSIIKINGIWLHDESYFEAILLSAYPYIQDAPEDVRSRVIEALKYLLEEDENDGFRSNANGLMLLEKLQEDETFERGELTKDVPAETEDINMPLAVMPISA